MGNVDPNRGMDGIRDMVRQTKIIGVRAFGAFNAGYNPQVGIPDPLDVPDLRQVCGAGRSDLRLRGSAGAAVSDVAAGGALIDQVMYDFPELCSCTRHGCEP